MSVEFTVVFVSDSISPNVMNEFRKWLSDRLGEQLFVDHFRTTDISVYFGPVVELLSFKEEV